MTHSSIHTYKKWKAKCIVCNTTSLYGYIMEQELENGK